LKLLALECSTDACSVALAINNEIILDHRIAPQKHAQLLLPMIDKMLTDAGVTVAQLDGIAFGCGPGSFTGVRIAAAATQGLAFGADLGVIPVSSLQALAQRAFQLQPASPVFACFDARMDEVYWGAYASDADGIVQPLQAEQVCSPQAVTTPQTTHVHEWSLAGSGALKYENELHRAVGSNIKMTVIGDSSPSAQDVLSVAMPIAKANGYIAAAEALPVYLRNRVALTESQRAAGEQL